MSKSHNMQSSICLQQWRTALSSFITSRPNIRECDPIQLHIRAPKAALQLFRKWMLYSTNKQRGISSQIMLCVAARERCPL